MNPKNMPIGVKPLAEVQQYVGESIETLKKAGATDMLHLALSIAEYLKDAARWHEIRDDYLRIEPSLTQEQIERLVHAAIAIGRG